MACASAAMMPLVARNETLMVLPAPMAEVDLRARLSLVEAAAIIKLGRHTAKVIAILRDLDLLDGAHYIAHATMPDEVVQPLADVAVEDVPYFAMILVRRNEVGS
jgi:precorrin-2/cobalt-factor-2 C20-methyltransferase